MTTISLNTNQTRFIIVELLRKCYKRCDICLDGSSPDGPQMSRDTLEGVAADVKGYLAGNDGKLRLLFSGGEPLLYQNGGLDVIAAAELFKHEQIGFALATTGRLTQDGSRFKEVVKQIWPEDLVLGTSLYMKEGMYLTRESMIDLISMRYSPFNVNVLFKDEDLERTVSCFLDLIVDPLGGECLTKMFDYDGNVNRANFYDRLYRVGEIPIVVGEGFKFKVDFKEDRNFEGWDPWSSPRLPATRCRLLNNGALEVYVTYDGLVLPCCQADMIASRGFSLPGGHPMPLREVLNNPRKALDSVAAHLEANYFSQGFQHSYQDICHHCSYCS